MPITLDTPITSTPRLTDAIVDGETGKAPAQNAVYDALALKQDIGGSASTSTVTATGASVAFALSRVRDWLAVEDFGAVGDGSTDDSTAIQNAINAAYTYGYREVRFKGLVYAIGTKISVGNGSSSAYSTKNGLILRGMGAPFNRLDNSSSPLEDNGTRLLWIGASGGTMMEIAGPCQGNSVQFIAFNCNDLADFGLILKSASRGTFESITASDFLNTGLRLTVVSAETISATTEAISCEGNVFRNTRLNGNETTSGTVCLDLDGYTGSAANGWDSVRNTFDNTYLVVNRVGGTGIRLAYCDQNVFHNTFMSGFGTADGNQSSIKLVGTATTPSSYKFPQNNVFDGHLDIGQQLPLKVTGTPGGGNTLPMLTTFDQQPIPTDDASKYFDFRTVTTGAFPKGGFVAQGGQTVLERSLRNKLRNSKFSRVTLGTSFASPSSGDYTLDDWLTSFDGSVTETISQQSFTLGQTAVPYEPKYFARVDITSASGGTFNYFGCKVPGVEQFEGRKAVLSVWLKADASCTVSGRAEQRFGTGGSPSTAVTASSTLSASVTTTWTRFALPFDLASISGKTLGTGGDDFISVYLVLPINTVRTIDVALPQFEAGDTPTAFEQRPDYMDELLSSRFMRIEGAGRVGAWSNTTTLSIGIPLDPPMFKTPAASLSTVTTSSTALSPNTGTFTVNTVSLTNGDKNGCVVALGGATGATAKEIGIVYSSIVVLKAYP